MTAPSVPVTRGRPSELTVTLACLRAARDWSPGAGWVVADQVRGALDHDFGIDATTQQVAAWLNRMARAECPWVEVLGTSYVVAEYRVTRYGKTDIENKIPALRVTDRAAWL